MSTRGRGRPSEIVSSVIFVCGVLTFASAGMRAQSLQVLPSVTSQKSSGSFRIQWTAAAAKPVLALQWNLRFPEGIQILPDDIAVGSAAESAEKSLYCSRVPRKTPGSMDESYVCIVAGGQKPISDGAVAVVLYSIRKGTAKGAFLVHIEKVLGVGVDTQVLIADAESTITIK